MKDFSKLLTSCCFAITLLCGQSSEAVNSMDRPISTDSRIRTFVYSEHEVFRIVVHYGYQTNIEFSNGEEVQTISVGNNYAWQLSPLGSRLFIKPLEENILTNMTLITNKRTYQFELQSKDMLGMTDDELVYVVKFFYPDAYADRIAPDVVPAQYAEPVPSIVPYNFNYSISGGGALAPVKVFDDGINTYFKFPENMKSQPVIKRKEGKDSINMTIQKMKDYILVNAISASFSITVDGQTVEVTNNKLVVQKDGKSK